MKLMLEHGRFSREESPRTGFAGPVLDGVETVKSAHLAQISVQFESEKAAQAAKDATNWPMTDSRSLQMTLDQQEGLVWAAGKFYADWRMIQ